MNRIVEIISLIVDFFRREDFLRELLDALSNLDVPVDWGRVLRILFILMLTLFLTGLLFFLNELIFERYMNKRIKQHKLTITNNGNTPSIFLLRSVDIPKTLAIRFRVDGRPLIRVTYAPKNKEEEKAIEPEKATVIDVVEKKETDDHMNSLIPDLNDPLAKGKKVKPEEAVSTVTNTVNEIGKKAGFFASILSSISSLLPVKIGGIQDAQASLKGIQQQATQVTSTIGTKMNTMSSLGDQLGKLPMADSFAPAAQSAMQNAGKLGCEFVKENLNSGQIISDEQLSSDPTRNNVLSDKNFVYDEEVWNKNIGKVDELGGSLNYFQSKILKPGESMKIGVEIMNLSDSSAAVTHLYKIEVLQIPQTHLTLTAPTRFVNGIVIYEKGSFLNRILPQMIMIGLVIIAIQIIAGASFLIF